MATTATAAARPQPPAAAAGVAGAAGAGTGAGAGAGPGAAGAPVRRALPAAAAESAVNVLALMEDIVDKLKLLDYENKFCNERENMPPFTRVYFALPGKATDQFSHFSSVVGWLLKEAGVDFIPWNDFDDPNQILSSVMEQLTKLGFQPDFPVSKLRAGSGEAVCVALNFLCDKTLAAKHWKVQPIVHTSAPHAEEAAVDEQAAVAEEADAIEEEVAEDHGGDDAVPLGRSGADDKLEEKAPQETIEPKTSPAEWRLELERVMPRLRFRAEPPSKEWRTHLEQCTKSGKLLSEQFPETKTALLKNGTNLRKAAERISAKERHINKEFEHLGTDYRDKQKKAEAAQEVHDTLRKSVDELTAELAAKGEAIDALKRDMHERNNFMTDTAPLRRISAALAALKQEVAGMELRIGVVSQTLLQAKLRVLHQQQQTAVKTPGSAAPPLPVVSGDEDDD